MNSHIISHKLNESIDKVLSVINKFKDNQNNNKFEPVLESLNSNPYVPDYLTHLKYCDPIISIMFIWKMHSIPNVELVLPKVTNEYNTIKISPLEFIVHNTIYLDKLLTLVTCDTWNVEVIDGCTHIYHNITNVSYLHPYNDIVNDVRISIISLIDHLVPRKIYGHYVNFI